MVWSVGGSRSGAFSSWLFSNLKKMAGLKKHAKCQDGDFQNPRTLDVDQSDPQKGSTQRHHLVARESYP